jgi:hypothetical protein
LNSLVGPAARERKIAPEMAPENNGSIALQPYTSCPAGGENTVHNPPPRLPRGGLCFFRIRCVLREPPFMRCARSTVDIRGPEHTRRAPRNSKWAKAAPM